MLLAEREKKRKITCSKERVKKKEEKTIRGWQRKKCTSAVNYCDGSHYRKKE
jgi:hypothetical protein